MIQIATKKIQQSQTSFKEVNLEKEKKKLKKKLKKELKKDKITKQTIDIIRTTQRINIDLTAIADNKANVLLSLNAIMLTWVIPLVLSNSDLVMNKYLFIPLIALSATCFATIYLCAQVLTPSDFDTKRTSAQPDFKASPFFFGNFYKMNSTEYYDFLSEGLTEEKMIKAHLAQDLFYIGRQLGNKMAKIRNAFRIFTIGLFTTISTAGIVLFLF